MLKNILLIIAFNIATLGFGQSYFYQSTVNNDPEPENPTFFKKDVYVILDLDDESKPPPPFDDDVRDAPIDGAIIWLLFSGCLLGVFYMYRNGNFLLNTKDI